MLNNLCHYYNRHKNVSTVLINRITVDFTYITTIMLLSNYITCKDMEITIQSSNKGNNSSMLPLKQQSLYTVVVEL